MGDQSKVRTIAGFLNWALRQELIDKNSLVKLNRVKVVPSLPQGLPRKQVGDQDKVGAKY
jgi:hypothetical protein